MSKHVLTAIQCALKAPKSRYNSFGKYSYRSCEDILEAVKPFLEEHNALLTLVDEIVEVGGRVYVKATAKFGTEDFCETVTAYAREPETKKGMDESQITGTASSYARKYALNGLFLIDDTKDPDTDEYKAQTEGVELKKIGKARGEALTQAVTDCGKDMNKLLAWYHVETAADLTEAQHFEIMKKVKGA